jgi:DNA-binding XRE family transcriptional regulator
MENKIKEIRVQNMDAVKLAKLLRDIVREELRQIELIKEAQELPELLTQKQVTEYLQINRKTVTNLEKKKILNRVIIDDSIFRYNKSEVMAWKNK